MNYNDDILNHYGIEKVARNLNFPKMLNQLKSQYLTALAYSVKKQADGSIVKYPDGKFEITLHDMRYVELSWNGLEIKAKAGKAGSSQGKEESFTPRAVNNDGKTVMRLLGY